jgi:dTDP-4-amino-4,6-dideoxy-D-glucose acyltransferase
MAFISRDVLENMGFASLGNNVCISDKASIYNIGRISIGNNVRIDDYCVLSAGLGRIIIGNYIHMGVYASLIGAGNIFLSDYCNLSSRVSIYSSNDDYSGNTLTNPMVPDQFKNVVHKDVLIGKHVIIGCGSIILPGVTLEEGAAVGALSLVSKSCEPYSIYSGNPAKRIKSRSRNLLKLEKLFCSWRDTQ